LSAGPSPQQGSALDPGPDYARAPRVGLFGGSFDPPHRAHVALAQAALAARESLALDEIRWIPTGEPWQKLQPAPAAPGADHSPSPRRVSPAFHREAMVRLAIAGLDGHTLDAVELTRTGPSYTLDTVTELQAREPGTHWVLLIGGDQYANLHTWRHWRDLLSRVDLAVAARPGDYPVPDAAVQAVPHRAVPLPLLDISSTEIRRRAGRGLDISQLVPLQVARYIEQNGLYREGNAH
jgi:nicotinate-nucleotide adenylyltransferase